MEVSSSHQITVFFLYVLSGFLCGVFFDIQREFRRFFSADDARTFIEDLLFAIFTVFMTIAPGYFYNNGEMRYYQIIGILCGGIIYASVLSIVVTKVLHFLFAVVHKIIVIPMGKIYRFLMAPFEKFMEKLRKLKSLKKRIKKKVSRHIRRKKKTVKKRVKML